MINSALRMRWMAENEPEILRPGRQVAADRGFPELPALPAAGHRLQHGFVHAAVRSAAAGVVRGNAGGCRVSTAGCCARSCPAARPSARSRPRPPLRDGLPEGTPVVLGGHDHLCGAPAGGRVSARRGAERDGHVGDGDDGHAEPGAQGRAAQGGHDGPGPRGRGRHAVWGGNVAAEMLEWYRREFGQPATRLNMARRSADGTHLAEAAARLPGPGA